MIEQITFYVKHALNDLWTNKRLSALALLSIAAGVAAIVALQTLGLMIGNALQVNIQSIHRADIQLEVADLFDSATSSDTEFARDQAVDDGLINNPSRFFTQDNDFYYFSQDGIAAVQTWLDENYPDTQINYQYIMGDPITQVLGFGRGGAVRLQRTGLSANQVSPVFIPPDSYPFYGEIVTVDGTPIRDLLAEPTDILIDTIVAEQLAADVGDAITLNGSDEVYTVRGIVSADQEATDPFSGVFLALFGFYYLDNAAVEHFNGVTPQTLTLYIKLSDPDAQLNDAARGLREAFPYTDPNTTADVAEQNEQIAGVLDQLVTIMGLVSLLIGSIGIINTMQVVVRRRMLEIAVLKTVGMQAEQVTLLFLTQALLMGIFGSLIGVPLGYGSTLILRQIAQNTFGSSIPIIYGIDPALNGIIVGTLVATVFGLLPTLSAGQVRPGIVLRPNDRGIPRAGFLRMAAGLLFIILVITLIAQTIIGSFLIALIVTVGAFLAAGIIYGLLLLIIWLIGRFFPAFGSVDLKVSLRQMLAGRTRAATTLLALVIGVFSLSLITLFAATIQGVLTLASQGIGGNVLVTALTPGQRGAVEAVFDAAEGVNRYETTLNYQGELIAIEDVSEGVTYTPDELIDQVSQAVRTEMESVPGVPVDDIDIDQIARDILGGYNAISARPFEQFPDRNFAEGRDITATDIGTPVIVIRGDDDTEYAGFSAGDKLTYRFGDDEITFEAVGITRQNPFDITLDTASVLTYEGAIPTDPTQFLLLADVEPEAVGAIRRDIGELRGAFIVETSVFTRLLDGILGAFTAFPTMIAVLGLIVGGVVIANSVALTTMERRREIAVMKAVGLQRERVLFMLLLENGVLGLIGGLVGVGIGLVALILMLAQAEALQGVPYASAFGLMLVCVLVAVTAAFTTAWGASGEKPLNVLRYE